jgi:hypothetical protein
MPVLWAGKHLDPQEEGSLRRIIALLRRIEEKAGSEDERKEARCDRLQLEFFLPESAQKWSPDELEFGAHHGPWFQISEETPS